MIRTRFISILGLVFACAVPLGCSVDDADLEGSGLVSFALTPASTSVDVLQVDVTGTAGLAYLSDDDATLEILVNGASAYVESFDASTSRDLAFSATLPLQEGDNDIVARLTYNGHELAQRVTVLVEPAAPTLAFPSWTTAFTQTGTVTVTLDANWTVDEVAFSVDGGGFAPAADLGAGAYDVALTELDIGDSDLVVRVSSSNRGYSQVHEFQDTIAGVVPVWDCNNPNAAMQPDTELLEQLKVENRTMVGYFGDPDGGHTFTFLIEYDDQGDPFQTVGAVVSPGRTSMMVGLDIDRADCGNNPCTQNYALSLYVDGNPTPVCSNNSFGVIRRY